MPTFIYLVENCYNDPNKVYIGKTKNISDRKYFHRKTFSKNINFTIIDQIDSLKYEDWAPLEIYWIEQFKQWGYKVMNQNKGGGGPEHHSEKTINFLRQLATGRPNFIKGKNRPWDTNRKNKSQSEKSKSLISQKNSKKVAQYSKDNKLIQIFNSYTLAKQITGIDSQQVLRNECKTAGGYLWKYI
jgi:hypothetical protein